MSQKQILVVDDEPDIREVMMYALKIKGHKVQVADCSDEAFVAARATPHDVIFLDHCLSISETKEFVDLVHSKNPAAKVILISARHDVEERAKVLGLNEWVAKPFDLDELHRIANL